MTNSEYRGSDVRTRTRRSAIRLALGLVAASLASHAGAADWRAVEIGRSDPVADAVLSFSASGGLTGTTGCNRFTGSARVEAGALVFERPLATTRMACPGDGLARQEDMLIALLQGRVEIRFDPFADTLTLANGDLEVLLERVPVSFGPEIPPTHGGRDRPAGEPPYLSAFGIPGDLGLRAAPSADAPVLGTVMTGTVMRNAGCRDAGEGQWCELSLPDGSLSGWAEREFLEAADGALRAGQGLFDATGLIPCAMGAGAPMTQCSFGVARDGGGNATVAVTRPDGMRRILWFEKGEFAFTDSSQAGGGFDTSASREADLSLIRIDDERYEVPDAVLHGG